jgi:hypothetical protein
MNTILKKISVLATVLLVTVSAQAQKSIWSPVSESRVASMDLQERNAVPSSFQLFELDKDALRSAVSNAPKRNSGIASNVIIEFPTQDGTLEKFRVLSAPVLSESLGLRYPGITSYAAQGIDDPTAIARFSEGTDGIYVMITSGNYKTIYIDPYTKNGNYFIQYSRSAIDMANSEAQCLVEESVEPSFFNQEEFESLRNADDGMLRTFRLALACNGEYAQYHLNQQGVPSGASDTVKKAAVMSAMNTAMTRVNGVFERDLALTMQFVPNNDDVIFLDTNTDGLTNDSSMINQIQPIIDGAIGSANYDIGHVFSTGGGGIAQLNSPCTSGKARGVTGLFNPINDSFYIDFVAHEMGHQYGGNHTQNNDCQRSNVSVEPGSASTIMGYAGICSPNVQNNSDDYFNGANILEMWNNINTGNSSCANQTPTGNDAPVADAGADFTIPGQTPFILKGMATDPNAGDALTYCWEARDTQTAPMPPQASNTGGPNFRSLDPVTSPDRYLPKLQTVLNGQLGTTWERLASVDRPMRFRFTVRDNVAGGGSSSSDNNFITVDGDSGPFMITVANATGVVWTTQTTETVTWDVAGTDGAPVNTATVDILFSEDGGQTFDRVLATATPNDGSQVVNVPTVNTTEGRIMIVANDNIYYDINNRNFTVVGSLGVTDIALSDLALYPNPNNGQFTISFTANAGEDVNVAMYDVRGRLINSKDYTNNASNFSETLDYRNLSAGMYFVTITNGNQQTTKKLTIR